MRTKPKPPLFDAHMLGRPAVPAPSALSIAERPGFDLQPPPDFNVDFFCIGTPKSRSTWLARCVAEHPDVCVSIPKETNFFARHTTLLVDQTQAHFLRGWPWYRDCFSHARPHQKRGDFTINLYRNGPEAVDLVHEAFPDARLVALLRHPIKRLYSHYWHRASNPRAPPLRMTPEQALLSDAFLDTSRYHAHLRPWARRFGRDQLLVLLDEDLQTPLAGVQAFYRHIGVQDDFVPPSLDRVVQPIVGQKPMQRSAARAAQLLRKAGAGRLVDVANRQGLKRWFWEGTGRSAGYPPLDPELARRVYDRLADDIDQLEAWLGRDLASWRPDQAH